jgi:hypothetical protein
MGHSMEPSPPCEEGDPSKCVRRQGYLKSDISRLYFVFQATNHILTGRYGMNSKRIQLLLTGVTVWISLLLMITATYGGSIVIGGNYTNIGTIVIVSPKPGDTPQTNGTALLNNLAGIIADASNPYLIKLGPGIYDIGTSSLQMKPYVDVEGSGENTTIITGSIDSGSSGVVRGASNAEIRFLTVRNIGGGSNAVAIYNTSASPKITNVTVSASDGTSNYGVYNGSSSPTMTNVTVFVSGGESTEGVINFSSSPWMTDVTVSASGEGFNFAVDNYSSSPTMTNVTASASGGELNVGVSNSSSSSPTMTNVSASASGGSNTNVGVLNSSSSPTMRNVTASASGGSIFNVGVSNGSSSPTMTNVTASASGGNNSCGVNSVSSGTIMINNSVIKGSTNTIYNAANTTTLVGNTKLDGSSVANSGALTCVGAYNGNYVALNTSCQ